MLSPLLRLLLAIIYPEHCCACGKFGSYLCESCRLRVDFALEPVPLHPQSAVDSIHVVFHYRQPINQLIHAMKYQLVKDISLLFGESLYFHTDYPSADVVTSVPLTQEKERSRGFNQAKEIAKIFAKFAQIPYRDLLHKDAAIQTSQASIKDRRLREKNLKQTAFKPILIKRVPQSVILIDDVYTTGATMSACAAALKEMGVKYVYALAVAHGA